MSDYVVSHGSECLETHGWVQLGAITEAVCVHHDERQRFLPSPLPAYGVGGALPLLLLRGRAPAHL